MNINSVDELIEHVVNTTDKSLPKLYQIRYIYLETGKYLEKNTDFFFSLKNKLGNYNYSSDMIKKIYEDDKTGEVKEAWNKVVCRGTAIILKRIFDQVGIKSRIVRSTAAQMVDGDYGIHHYFVVASDDKDNYFLSLNADLGNIQNHMQTKHFGRNINYLTADGRQVYEGPFIKNRYVSDDELYVIDKRLGYTTRFNYTYNGKVVEEDVYYDKFFEILSQKLRGDRWYIDRLSQDTDFYKGLGLDNGFILDKSHINDLELLKKKIYNSFGSNFNSYEDWLLDNKIREKAIGYNNDDLAKVGLIKSIVSDINRLEDTICNDKFTYNDAYRFNNSFERKINRLSSYFINTKYLPPSKDKPYASNDYICKKLEVLFSELFNANSGYINEFNKLGYSEQEDLIKSLILGRVAFNDIHKVNSLPPKELLGHDEHAERAYRTFDDNIPPIYNRIYFRAARNKNDGRYSLTFTIMQQTNSEIDRYYVYDLQKNTFKEYRNSELIDFYKDWRVCRTNENRLGNDLDIEDIEDHNYKL